MIDFILFTFLAGFGYLCFKAGAKFGTLKSMTKAVRDHIKTWMD